ncbi:uncharacterized protein LOC108671959 [Hyalella azteca]|uniref:Uncharacterized protein LOC108671959 n=1 Tax=Hyalella azteca TaxID=294128 RepID=A0A8B7NMY9_HYAAZ|nr:uncharacterized protein LOC108671959 [Hyalella azteca]
MSSVENPALASDSYTVDILKVPNNSLQSGPAFLTKDRINSSNLDASEDLPFRFESSLLDFGSSNSSVFSSNISSLFNFTDELLPKKLSDFTEEIWLHASWWGLAAILILLLTALGNVFVIMAISWERRLQNMTNYFLMSLAVTDLMVAVLVMPFAIVELTIGRFPFSSELCLTWICLDVLFCTASIMHLCTISVDRFLSLRYPMKFGRNKTCRRVLLKLVLVWCCSLACSLPLSLMYATDSKTTIAHGTCQIPASLFQIIGSVICFYIPLTIMIATYALTVRLLSFQKTELLKRKGVKASRFGSQKSVKRKKFSCRASCIASGSVRASTGSSLSDLHTDDMRQREMSEVLEETDDILVDGKSQFDRSSVQHSFVSNQSPAGIRKAQIKTRNVSTSSRSDDDVPSVELTVLPSSHSEKLQPVKYTHVKKLCAQDSPKIVISSSSGQIDAMQSPECERLIKTEMNAMHISENSEIQEPVFLMHEETSPTTSCSVSPKHSPKTSIKYREDSEKICDPSEVTESFMGRRKSQERNGNADNQCDSSTFNGTSVAVPCSCAPRFFLEGFERVSGSTEGRDNEGSAACARPSLRASPSEDSTTTWSRCSPCCGAGSDECSADLGSLESPWQEESVRRTATAEMVAKLVQRSGLPVTRVIRKFGTNYSSDSGSTSATNTNTNNTPVHHTLLTTTTPHHHHRQPCVVMEGRNGGNGCNPPADSIARGVLPTPTKLWRCKSTTPLKMASSKRHGRNIKMEQKATKVLGVVFFTFVVLWSPFFIMNVLTVICPACANYIPGDVMSFVTWLGYISSTVNPFFYTFFNKTFRETFWKIATCKMKPFRKYHRYHR